MPQKVAPRRAPRASLWTMRVLLTGFIREEKGDLADEEELIADIKRDCEVARRSLDREAWSLRGMGRGTLDGSWLVRGRADAGSG